MPDTRLDPVVRRMFESLSQLALGMVKINTYPSADNVPATSEAWDRTVNVSLTTPDNTIIHNGVRATATGAVTIADTSVAGTATLASADLVFHHGTAMIKVSGNAAAWLAGETVTVTIADFTLGDTTITGGTVVYTVV